MGPRHHHTPPPQECAPESAYVPPISNEDLGARLAIVEARSERMEKNLTQLIILMQASKALLTFLRWIAPIAAVVVAAFSYYKGPKS